MAVNKNLLILGLLVAVTASQLPRLVRGLQQGSISTHTQQETLIAQRACNPSDPSACP